MTSACIPDTSRAIRSLTSASAGSPASAASTPSRFLATTSSPTCFISASSRRRSTRICRACLADCALGADPPRTGPTRRHPRSGARPGSARRSRADASRNENRPSNSWLSNWASGGRSALTVPSDSALRTTSAARAPRITASRRSATCTGRTGDRPATAASGRPRAGATVSRLAAAGRDPRPTPRRDPHASAGSAGGSVARHRRPPPSWPSASTDRNSSWKTAGVGATARCRRRVEQVLQPVRQVGDAGVAHRRRHALDRVDGAEQPADRLGRGGLALPLEQQLVAGAQVLPALGQEQRGVLRDDPSVSPGRAAPPRARGKAGTA